MADQKGMAPKLMRWMLLKTDNLLLKVDILAILLLVILPNFTRESIIDFTRSSFLSLGISRYRRLIDTTSALPPHYLWMNWLERAVSLYLIILYHRATNFSGIAFGFYLMSTICSSSIVYFMPTRKWRGLLNNPNPRKTNKGEALVQKTERLMFWLERLVGVVSIFLIPRFASFSDVFFCFSDFIYLICFALRLEINPLPTKPDYLFWIERLAIMILELHSTDQTPNSLFIARGLFFLTNSCYIVDFYTPAFINKDLISKTHTPKLREAEKGLQPEKEEANIAADSLKENFEVHHENNNWDKELVAKYGFMDHISEFTRTKIEDESPKEKFEVDENNSWEKELVDKYGFMEHISEFTCTKTKDTTKSEIKQEASKEENYNWEEELVAKYGFMEHVSELTCTKPKEIKKSEIEEEASKEENYKWPWIDDMFWSEGFGRFETYKDLNEVDDKWGKQLVIADEINNVDGNGSSDPIEDDMKTTINENESNEEALLLEDIGEVERLRAENDNLKREKEALEDKLKAEKLEHEYTLLKREMHDQKLDAMLVEVNLKYQALVEELDSYSKFGKQMLASLKAYKEDCRKLEQESRGIATKFQDVTADIGKDQQTSLNDQGNLCKCKAERKKWESEKTALNEQLDAANSWYHYYFEVAMTANSWNQYYLQRENNYRHCMNQLKQATTSSDYYYRSFLRDNDDYIYSLVKSNNDLAKRFDEETNLCTRYQNRVSEYKQKCRVLEEDNNNLTAKLCAAIALSELYPSMSRDLAS